MEETRDTIRPIDKILSPVYGAMLAVSFLTRFPIPVRKTEDAFVWKWSTAFYPACGYLLAICAVAPFYISTELIHSLSDIPFLMLSLFYFVGVIEWLTRMLHFDGFCDCCDGFSAMTMDKQKRLEIMKDPRVGSSAVCGAILLIGCKVFCLYLIVIGSSLVLEDTRMIVAALFAVPVFARFTMLILAAIGTYPREKGTASQIIGKVPIFALVFGLITVLPIVLYITPVATLFCFFFNAFVLFYWKIKADHKIGGVTGDVLGACCETAELATIVAFTLALRLPATDF